MAPLLYRHVSFSTCAAWRGQALLLSPYSNSRLRTPSQRDGTPTTAIAGPASRRWVSQGHRVRSAAASADWADKAMEIKQGKRKSFIQMLDDRGLINSVAGDRELLENIITYKRAGIYAGIDPTAPSLHIGHMLPFMVLAWAYVYGIRAVWLLGGSTAQIGDPSGRSVGRKAVHSSVHKSNMANMHMQLKKLGMSIEKYGEKYGYKREWVWRRVLQNNGAWWNKQTLAEVMQTLGRAVRIGPMLGRDTVKNRMENGDGMSFAEFTYPIMQTWDWWMLYQQLGVQVQVGGSDQFGNILFGAENLKQMTQNIEDPQYKDCMKNELDRAIGFTTPLLTLPSGEKMGKSTGNAIWLDPSLTTTFDLYQYFVRLPDQDVERYLKLFTFMPLEEIELIMKQQNEDPSQRVAQHALAYDFVELIHGKEPARIAQAEHRKAFSNSSPLTMADVQPEDFASSKSKTGFWNPAADPLAKPTTFQSMPSAHVTLPRSLVYNQSLHKVLWSAGLVASKGEGHRVTVNNGAYVGSRAADTGKMGDTLSYTPIKTWAAEKTQEFILDGGILILRIGKWKVKIVKIISDAEFEAKGLTAPGWKEDVVESK